MSKVSRPLSKTAITEAVLKHLPNTTTLTSKEVFPLWWHNKLRSGSMRLTDAGEQAFVIADIEGWNFDLDFEPKINYYEHLLSLNETIQCPYYIYKANKNDPNSKSKIKIKIYDSKIAMMIGLYGSVREYIEKQNPKRRK